AEPPLYFYAQAGCYAIFGASYGSARLLSLAAGVGAIGLCYAFAVRWTGSRLAGLWGAGLYSLSRWMAFTASTARPDMLCGVIGLAAVWCAIRWTDTRRFRWIVATGVLIGLGGLTHPFAIAYALQIALFLSLASRGVERLVWPAFVGGLALLVFSAWLPLIWL